MNGSPNPTESASPAERLDITAQAWAEVLAGQLAGLRGMTAGLEEALSASLCSCSPLSEESFVTFQRIDYMRQALKDIEGLLGEFGPNLDWRDLDLVTREAFARSVDMGDSIQTMVGGPPVLVDRNTPAETDSNAGELDLW